MICTQGFGLETGSSAYDTCIHKEYEKNIARTQFDARISTIHAELQILAKEKAKLSAQSSGVSIESILKRERQLINTIEQLKIASGC